jgi:hypothetical protein
MGFVSNSSTSSFCIYGVELDYKLKAKIEKVESTESDEDEDDFDEEVDLYELFDEAGLEYHSYEGGEFVGVSPFDINDDETGAQFKQRVADEISKVLHIDVSKKCNWHQEAYYS